MMPRIYALESVPVVGHLRDYWPPSISCRSCGRLVGSYKKVTFVFDTLSECALFASADGSYFITETLMRLLDSTGISGFHAHRPSIAFSDDYSRNTREAGTQSLPSGIYYFVISGRADGPWRRRKRGTCHECGQFLPADDQETDNLAPPQTVRVYVDSWHGDDLFYVTEPGPPIVTERFVRILEEVGDLRQEPIQNPDLIKRLMPRYAEQLAANNWMQFRCSRISPAEWVERDRLE